MIRQGVLSVLFGLFAAVFAMAATPAAAEVDPATGYEFDSATGFYYPLPVDQCSDGQLVCCPPDMEVVPQSEDGYGGVPMCQPYQEEIPEGGTGEQPSKGVYPVIGPAYIVNTDGDGAVCHDWPDVDSYGIVLGEGTLVTELEDGVEDGWQLVAHQVGSPSCFVWFEFLGPEPVVHEVPVTEPTLEEVDQAPIEEPVDETLLVSTLPSTGIGTLENTEAKPLLLSALILILIAAAFAVIINRLTVRLPQASKDWSDLDEAV